MEGPIGHCNVEFFIDAIKNYRLLYDRNSMMYHDTMKKERAWQKVADECGTTVAVAKDRFLKLKKKYAREVKKQQKGTVYKWILFERLNFLSEWLPPRCHDNGNQLHPIEAADQIETSPLTTNDSIFLDPIGTPNHSQYHAETSAAPSSSYNFSDINFDPQQLYPFTQYANNSNIIASPVSASIQTTTTAVRQSNECRIAQINTGPNSGPPNRIIDGGKKKRKTTSSSDLPHMDFVLYIRSEMENVPAQRIAVFKQDLMRMVMAYQQTEY